MSIRPGWFYHPDEEPHSLERLIHTYVTSVGGNATFNLNVPPMPNGKFDPRDVERLAELGEALKGMFARRISLEVSDEKESKTQCVYRVNMAEGKSCRTVCLTEDMMKGQRVQRFQLISDGRPIFEGTTIGYRRICCLEKPVQGTFDVRILSARAQASVSIEAFE